MRAYKYYIIGLTILLASCASKYSGWENVRIEQRITTNCKYITQQVCYPTNAHEGCANFHKKKAAENSANAVVIDRANSIGDGGIVANYYFCQ